MIKVSIIVPMYNVENYIEKSLDFIRSEYDSKISEFRNNSDIYDEKEIYKEALLFSAREKYLILFTKRIFSDRLLRKAEASPHVRLVCFPDMMS